MSIEIKKVSKRFKTVQALDNVSLSFGGNHIYGLLGNNGAGKTTLLNTIVDCLKPDSGAVEINGANVNNNDVALSQVFSIGEQTLFPGEKKVKWAFTTAEKYYRGFDAPYAKGLAEKFSLPENQKINALSTGYASIFRLIMALSGGAPYLLLDEPVLGLDARHRDLFYRELLTNYAEHPRTIVISTHLISEVEHLIEKVVILHEGKVLQEASAEDLRKNTYTLSGPATLIDNFLRGKKVLYTSALGGLKSVAVEGTPPEIPAGLELGHPSLQDYFIHLIEKEEAK